MAYEVSVVSCTSNGVKAIASTDVPFAMSADGMWYSPKASICSSGDILGNNDLYWLVLLYGSTCDLQLKASTQGDGWRIPSGCKQVRVLSVDGTVKRLKMIDGNYGMTKADAYSSSNAGLAAADMILEPGDFLVLAAGAKAVVQFSAMDVASMPYLAIPIGLLSAADR